MANYKILKTVSLITHLFTSTLFRAGIIPVVAGTSASSMLILNDLCGTYTGNIGKCQDIKITCATAIANALVVSVQMSRSGSNTHLMFEDLTVDSTASNIGMCIAHTVNLTIRSQIFINCFIE